MQVGQPATFDHTTAAKGPIFLGGAAPKKAASRFKTKRFSAPVRAALPKGSKPEGLPGGIEHVVQVAHSPEPEKKSAAPAQPKKQKQKQ